MLRKMPRGRTVRTPKKADRFIEALLGTGGNVTRACEAAALSKVAAYEWRKNDEAFAIRWEDAVEAGTEELEQEARRRAYEGVDEPVFYKGDECGLVRKYSDTLMIFLLKARKPDKYRDNIKHELSNPDGSPLMQPIADAILRAYGDPDS